MNITAEQQQVMTDVANYIKFKNIEINSEEDFKEAFRDYLINGSVSHWYLQKADDHSKKQFIKKISQSV